MVVGFNHNVRYRDQLFHVQTEDSGLKKPHIITLLYFGGTIIASKKTSYADITRVDNLEAVVEDLMKEQHKAMLRRLKGGEFDKSIQTLLAGRSLPKAVAPDLCAPPQTASGGDAQELPEKAAGQVHKKEQARAEDKSGEPMAENSLDEIILSYLVGDEKKN